MNDCFKRICSFIIQECLVDCNPLIVHLQLIALKVRYFATSHNGLWKIGPEVGLDLRQEGWNANGFDCFRNICDN